MNQRFAGRTVLVVDDEPDLRFLLRDALERAGFAVVEAAHGESALEQVGRLRPDAVVTDQMMPRPTGSTPTSLSGACGPMRRLQRSRS
ncbi:MAG: response regulator [Actinomycetota bacterium]|nr:response regulator [Actinomycetota bacterium]